MTNAEVDGGSAVRKLIWERKDAVDAKMAEAGFADLPADERDAWVLSLQLDVALEIVRRCMADGATADELALVRGRVAEAFRFGKRKALRTLKNALGRHPSLNAPDERGHDL